jgi:DNA-directed RNA polymerase specialized sigma24 family protein
VATDENTLPQISPDGVFHGRKGQNETMSAELLAHPDVVKACTGILRGGGIAPQDLGDAVSEVQVRVLHSLRNKLQMMWPQTVESWKALTIRSTQTYLFDRTKKARRRGKTDAGACETPDDHAARPRRPSERDPLDQKLAMGVLAEHLAESKDAATDLEIVDRLQAGQDQAEIAAELGLTHQQVRDRVRAIRKSFRRRLAGAIGTVAAAGFALFMVLQPSEPEAWTHVAVTPHPNAPEVVVTEVPPARLAAEIRDRARGACRSSEWSDCLELLDAAAERDPAGDQAPEIQAARDAATSGVNDSLRQMEAKPQRPKGH